jgi:mannose-1-phosphate guanylyltransferase
MALWAIVLAGGAGTRFWPASTPEQPKQLLPLVDPSETLLEATLRRIAPLVPASNVYVSTGAHLALPTRKILGSSAVKLLAEPVPRNTAPCIAWATATILAADPQALCIVLPSDHAITKPDAFLARVGDALDAARLGYLTTIGIEPTRAETGYGYIERGDPIRDGIFVAKRFVEKPDRARADEYVASGRFLWNAGMFFYAASTMMDAVREHAPDIAALLAGGNVEATFASMPSISIDHAIMEKARKVAVVPGDFGWSDLGSWQSAWELSAKDPDGNVLPAGSVAIDAHGNLVWDARAGRKARTYAVLGVSDLVIVETEDAVLVVPRDRAQDVRLLVERLKR